MRDALVLTVALLAAALLPASAGAAANSSQPLFSLGALLTIAPDLPGLARSALMSEAERIWRREGIALRWSAAPGHEPSSAPLRVLVISRREVLTTGTDAWTVGELVPNTGRRALAIASIAGAERVLAASRPRLNLLDERGFADYRLGIVLGRAVAHEIGHYLLATATHAQRGLMRAAIDAHEFADPGAKNFMLDEAAGHWVRKRLLAADSTDMPLPSTGFTYAQATETAFAGGDR